MPRPRVVRAGKTIDYKAWTSILSVHTVLSGNITRAVAGLNFVAPSTILRCRGLLQCGLDVNTQIDDSVKLGFGLGIISTDGFVSQSTATLPDPSGEPEYPWLWWYELTLWSEATATGDPAFGSGTRMVEIDTKAMRRVKPGETLTLITQYADIIGTPVVEMHQNQIRVLIGT